jgi:hypothetical protein
MSFYGMDQVVGDPDWLAEPIVIPKGSIPQQRERERDPARWEPTPAQIADRQLAYLAAEAPCHEMSVAIHVVQRLAERDNERQRAFEAKMQAPPEQAWTITSKPFTTTMTMPAVGVEPIESAFRRVVPERLTPTHVALLYMCTSGAVEP